MTAFLRWVRRVGSGGLSAREHQESIDLARALDYTAARRVGLEAGARSQSYDTSTLSLSKKRERVHREILVQTREIFQAVVKVNAMNSVCNDMRHIQRESESIDPRSFPMTGTRTRDPRDVNVVSAQYLDALRDSIGFNIRSSTSSVPNAGRGLWLDGTAAIGSVVSHRFAHSVFDVALEPIVLSLSSPHSYYTNAPGGHLSWCHTPTRPSSSLRGRPRGPIS